MALKNWKPYGEHYWRSLDQYQFYIAIAAALKSACVQDDENGWCVRKQARQQNTRTGLLKELFLSVSDTKLSSTKPTSLKGCCVEQFNKIPYNTRAFFSCFCYWHLTILHSVNTRHEHQKKSTTYTRVTIKLSEWLFEVKFQGSPYPWMLQYTRLHLSLCRIY